ncbi:MAG TPA: recombinase family protein [Anaerovoracaceae bacterium]|nr:recombinase family protein [Anaerovoracaceae bacterium]
MEKKTIEVIWSTENDKPVKPKGEKIRVAAYCRISRLKDCKKLNSLENQLKHYTHSIRVNSNYKLVGLYYDQQLSGATITERPGLRRLIRHCEEGMVELILTKSVSRFSRNSKDLLELVEFLDELGVTVIFEKENINTAIRKNKFFLTALGAVYQEEIRSTSESVSWGYQKRILEGNFKYHRQFGYEVITIDNKRTVVINEQEADIIREIYDLYLSGMKINDICVMLTNRGVESVTGKTVWPNSTINKLLKNPSYVGEKRANHRLSSFAKKVDFMRGIERDIYLIDDAYPRIISKDIFEKVQAKLSESSPRKSISVAEPHTCSKRIWCGLCDTKYHKNKKGRRNIWVCNIKHKQARLCDSPRIDDLIILSMMKNAFKLKYDFSNPQLLKNLKDELEWVNKNDRFEFHRLSNLTQLQIAREREKQAQNNKRIDAHNNVKIKEKVVIDFENLASMIEDDRILRVRAIEKLSLAKSAEEFFDETDIETLRAWILELTVFSLKDYRVRWNDDQIMEIGECDKKKTDMKEKRRNLIDEEIKLNSSRHINQNIVNIEEDEHTQISLTKEEGGTDSMQAEIVEYNPRLKLVERIRKEISNGEDSVANYKKPKKRIAAYARVSTDDPTQLGSLEVQMAYYTYSVLKNPDYQLVQVYYDEGISGRKTSNRPGFQQMIADCKKGKIDKIITKSISRFSRNTVECLKYIRDLRYSGISILFEKEEIDTSDMDSETLITVHSALAQEESRSLGESVAWSKQKTAQRGEFKQSTLPYGYLYNKYGVWVIEGQRARVIRRIYDSYLAGKSVRQIAAELTKDGVPTARNGKKWAQTTLYKTLRNPAYKGDLLFQSTYTKDTIQGLRVVNNGEYPMYYIEDHHDPIIDKKTWKKVEELIANNQFKREGWKEKTKHTREEFFKVFVCGNCGGLISHQGRSNKVDYWRCVNSMKSKEIKICNAGSLRQKNIEHTFMAMLLEMKNSKKLSQQVNAAIDDINLKPYEEEELEHLEAEIETHYQALYNTVEDGKKHGEDTEAIKTVTDKIMKLHDRIRNFEDRIEQVKDIKEEMKWLRKELLVLEPFNPKKERIPFRGDIFTRLIKSGTFLIDGVIEYKLSIGVSWTVRDNRKQYWKLPMKTK